jgi:hypothetical protein
MSGIDQLPQAKWTESGKQPGLKEDWVITQAAILQVASRIHKAPVFNWLDNTAVRVLGSSDIPIGCNLSGFPNVNHPGAMVDGGITDSRRRINSSNVDMDFDVSSNLWGTEKASQWYAIMAVAGDVDTAFTLKAMPWCRVSSQGSQVITLRNNANSANIGYGFTTNEMVDGVVYFVTGASKGMVRPITANNNDNTTGGTVTYGGTALTLAQGDWFIILPPTNFRFLGDVRNNASSNILQFYRVGNHFFYEAEQTLTPAHTAGTPFTLYSGPEKGLWPPLTALAYVYSYCGEPATYGQIKPAYGGTPWVAMFPSPHFEPVPIYDGNIYFKDYWDYAWDYRAIGFDYLQEAL